MSTNQIKNVVIPGEAGLSISLDIFFSRNKPQPLIVYAHGFNGFKDWGNFDLIAAQFAAAGFCFVKFNFSHNGTTPESPQDFVDMEAYGNNNYTKELNDLQRVIDWSLSENNPQLTIVDSTKVYLIGHSRGGGIVILKGGEEKLIRGIATWASVSECKTPWGGWSEQRIEKWKHDGVDFYTNARTKQQLPLYYQLYEDFQNNIQRLHVMKAVAQLAIPLLICHGADDEAVPVAEAYQLKAAAKNAELFIVRTDHVFGRKHPWLHSYLPQPTQDVVNKTIAFFKALSK